MATGRESLSIGSEQFYEFSCSICANDGNHTEAVKYCVECKESFCIACLGFHNKIMRQHELIDQAAMVSRNLQSNDLPPLPKDKCDVHHGRVIDMFCFTHEALCCTACIAEDHRSCVDVKYIPKLAKDFRNGPEITKAKQDIDRLRENLVMLKRARTFDAKRIKEQKQAIVAAIKETRDRINKHLDDLEQSAIDDINAKFEAYMKQINKDLVVLDEHLQSVDETIVKLTSADVDNDSQLFVDMKRAKYDHVAGNKVMRDVEKSFGNESLNFAINKELVNTVQSFGEIQEKLRLESLSLLGKFPVEVNEDTTVCDITEACIMPEGTLVLADSENRKLKLLDNAYNLIVTCDLASRTTGICRTSPTEVAVALWDKMKIQFAKVTETITLASSFSVGDKCGGVAYSDRELYVACGGDKRYFHGPGRVEVYDLSGTKLRRYQNFTLNGNNIFSGPHRVATNSFAEYIHVADDKYGIITIDKEGSVLASEKYNHITHAMGLCVSNTDTLVVTGYLSNNVVLVKNGKAQRVLLSEKDGMKKPQSVLYDRANSRLIVTMENVNHICVYEIDS